MIRTCLTHTIFRSIYSNISNAIFNNKENTTIGAQQYYLIANHSFLSKAN